MKHELAKAQASFKRWKNKQATKTNRIEVSSRVLADMGVPDPVAAGFKMGYFGWILPPKKKRRKR